MHLYFFVNFMYLQYEESEKIPWLMDSYITGSELKKGRFSRNSTADTSSLATMKINDHNYI